MPIHSLKLLCLNFGSLDQCIFQLDCLLLDTATVSHSSQEPSISDASLGPNTILASGLPAVVSKPFQVIIFDWDGTAVPSRTSDTSALSHALEQLLATGTLIVIITGTHLGHILHPCIDSLPPCARKNLFICTNRGSEVFTFDEVGQPKLLYNYIATPEENTALNRTASELTKFLNQHKIDSATISDRLNRRKVDLIPTERWKVPKKEELPDLLKDVQSRLKNAGILQGLGQILKKAVAIAYSSGLKGPKLTSDVKHVEIGLTDKSDSIRWLMDHVLLPRKIPPENIAFIGDEFGSIGGCLGSDSLMRLPGLEKSHYLSVGTEPEGVPLGVIHLPGGPKKFLEIIYDQIALNPTFKNVREHDSSWLLEQEGFDPAQEDEMETLFALGNGYLGIRGASDLLIPSSQPDLFIAGIYDQKAEDLPFSELGLTSKGRRKDPFGELVPLPSPFPFRITVNGVQLKTGSTLMKSHTRLLDLKHAVLSENWQFKDHLGHETQIRTNRWASLHDLHILFQEIEIQCLNHDAFIHIDLSFKDPDSDLRYPHLSLMHPEKVEYLSDFHVFDTKISAIRVAMSTKFFLNGALVKEAQIRFQLKAGKPAIIGKIISIFSSRDGGNPAEQTRAHLFDKTWWHYNQELLTNFRKWDEFWHSSDVNFHGDPATTHASRFSLYHLRIAADHDSRTSIGAKALIGRAYEGHVFWDTEIFLLPFYIHNLPEIAKNLLIYRYQTIEGAKRRATEMGYQGACYAWESTVTGDDVTPHTLHIEGTNQEIPIFTGLQQIHVTSDVAYAVWRYWNSTQDHEFLIHYGAEILFESARFWVSRVKEKQGFYHILGVVGPDEYHHTVDNNAYTNWMAKFNLEKATWAFHWIRDNNTKYWNKLSSKLSLHADECIMWRHVCDRLYFPKSNDSGVIEQFDNFFQLKKVPPERRSNMTAPIDRLFLWDEVNSQQILKQADVLMIPFLFPEAFSNEVIAANYQYYEPITDHGSSLSPSVHAAIAAKIGLWDDVKKYWELSLDLDLLNLMKNTALGIHLGNMGGAWQGLIFHILGIKFIDDKIEIANQETLRIPSLCHEIELKLLYRSKTYPVKIKNKKGI